MLSPGQKLAILADVCDAADPDLTEEQRAAAAQHAAGIDPGYAVEMAGELLGSFVVAIRHVFGDDIAANTMAQIRARAASYVP